MIQMMQLQAGHEMPRLAMPIQIRGWSVGLQDMALFTTKDWKS